MADLKIHTIEMPMPGMLGTVNCYLIESDGRGVLVDTGMADDTGLERLEKKLVRFGVSIGSLEKVICTHYHPDHCGLGQRLQEEGVTLAMSAADTTALLQYFENPQIDASRAVFYGEHETPSVFVDHVVPTFEYLRTLHREFVPNEILENGQLLNLMGHLFEVVVTPGHTDGHLCLLHSASETLITGDHILNGSTVHIALGRESQFRSPLKAYLEALERIASLGPLNGLAGHGQKIVNTEQRCRELIQVCRQRTMKVKDAITEKPVGAHEISEKAFGVKRRPFSKWLCMAQTISILEYMDDEKSIGAGKIATKRTYWAD